MQYLVINNSKNGLYSIVEQYQLFDDREEASRHYFEIGGDSGWISLSDKPGMASMTRSGLIDVLFIPIVSETN
jgi:hypothetical protein